MDFDIHGVLLLVCLCNGLSTSFVLNAVVQVHNQEFRCGGYVCHRHEKCVIEENRHKQLHFRCEGHTDHHTPHCVPNILSADKRCLCLSRSCVDNILISLVSGHQVTGLICSDHDDLFCHSNQVCELHTDKNGVLKKHCSDGKHVHVGLCTRLPDVDEKCYCITQECVFGQFNALLVKAGGGGNHTDHNIFCLTSQCYHDEVCRLHNTNGHLNGQCINKHNEPYKQADRDGCPHILGKGHECFCNNNDCVQQTQAATGHHTVTTTNHNDLVCGDHVCHGHQFCIIEEKQDGKLHLKCADVHNTQHCLPNLLSLGSSCFCDTRTCVDHTLISIVAAQTTMLPTAGPTVAASTTIQQSTVQPTTVQPTTVQTTTAQPTMAQPTTAQPNTSGATTGNSSITVALTNTPIVQSTSSIPTTTVVTAVTSSTNSTCTDDEDSNFSCVVYEMKYGLCNAITGTLFNIAQKRCQAFCGICAGNKTSGTPPASLPTQTTCIDHDARCSQYQQQICSSTVSQNYVISTCPKSCNKCAEYLASLNPPTTNAQSVTTTTTGTRTCHICGEMTFQIPCSNRQIGRDLPQTCKTGEDYCMTDIVQDAQGNVDVFKRCVDLATCENKWNTESAGLKYCKQYGAVPNPDAYSCHFCCTQDKCNSMLVPNATTWYTKTN